MITTESEALVMDWLDTMEGRRGLTPSQLTTKTRLPAPTVAEILLRFLKKGYVTRFNIRRRRARGSRMATPLITKYKATQKGLAELQGYLAANR